MEHHSKALNINCKYYIRMEVTDKENTLAYCNMELTTPKSFIVEAPVGNRLKKVNITLLN
jgi:hypothetical protein